MAVGARRGTLLVVDQIPLFRKALGRLLVEEGFFDEVVDTGSPPEAKKVALERRIDMAVIDLSLSDQGALDLLRQIKETRGACRCVILLQDARNEKLMAAIRLEAEGFLTKNHTPAEFVDLVGRVLNGQMAISDSLTNILALTLKDGDEHRSADCLTPREQEVLRAVASGLSNKEIAVKLSISDGTVKVHVKHMLKKLGFRSRVEAAIWASRKDYDKA